MIEQLEHSVNKYLRKRKAINEPLEAFVASPQGKAFEALLADGIKKQGAYVAKYLRKLDDPKLIQDDMEPLSADQSAYLNHAIDANMPSLSQYVSETKTFNYFKDAFAYGVEAQYKRMGIIVKSAVNFNLTNEQYLASLKDQSNYLLNRSRIDDTTRQRVIDMISNSKQEGFTVDEIADQITNDFDDISDARASIISRTETNNAMSSGQSASMKENGVQSKSWVVAGPGCDICDPNEDDGEIGVNEMFSSGDDAPPAHPNCECYLEAGEIDLDSIDVWGGE